MKFNFIKNKVTKIKRWYFFKKEIKKIKNPNKFIY